MTHAPVKKNESKDGEETAEIVAPDGGWGWMVVVASFMVHIFTDGMTYSFGMFYKEYLTYFDEGKGYTAWIVSILVGVTLCSGPISSSFVNRYGCQAVTIGGAILAAICVIISSFATNVLTLIFTIGIGAGLGFGLIYLPAIVSVTVWFDKYRSFATGIAVCGSGIGTMIFSPLTDTLIIQYGWRGAMAIIGALMLNCVVFGAMFKPVPPPKQTEATQPMLEQKASSPLKRSRSTDVVQNGVSNGNGDAWRLTLSQPALNGNTIHRTNSGLMLRPDVLYTGSMASLSKHRSASPAPFTSRAMSEVDMEKSQCSWLPCAAESKAALAEMLDMSLCKDPIFVLYALSNFLTSIGFYIPYVYIAPQAEVLKIDSSKISYLISVVGIANCVGRIILGFISDKPWVNRLFVYNMCLTIAGAATVLSVFCTSFWSLAVYSSVFGFFIGAYVGLTSVVLVDLLGIEKLTNAFGLLLLFQGFASLIGSPLAGWLYDFQKSYDPGFYLAGVTMAASGLMLFIIPYIQRRQAKVNNIDLSDMDI